MLYYSTISSELVNGSGVVHPDINFLGVWRKKKPRFHEESKIVRPIPFPRRWLSGGAGTVYHMKGKYVGTSLSDGSPITGR